MFIQGINIHPVPKDQLLKKLQFFIDKKILTPSNICFLPQNLFYLSVPLIEYLEKISFFDNNPFFDEQQYIYYSLHFFQQYLVLFCMGQESNEL